MDGRTTRILEFHKIKEKLVEYASFQVGKELAEKLEPMAELEAVRRGQAETSEALLILWREGAVPLGGVRDIRGALHRAQIGSTLEPGELLAIESTLSGSRRLKKFLGDLDEKFPILRDLAFRIEVHKEIEEAIRQCISEFGDVLDSASPELARVRTQIRTARNRVKDRLDSLVRSTEAQKYLQDPIVTLRNERYVVPVKQEYKAFVPGIIHDQSASGATLFVEPMAVVELNNQLRQLEAAEEEEILRILRRLTALVQARVDGILATVEVLGRIDFMFAKARLSKELNAVEPALNRDGRLNFRRARHPLLTGEVVPIDVHLGRDFTTLVITGPNTGGKTVTLKTVGLLTLMAQSGLHIPAAEGSEAAVFARIFADIGDEQSIEQNLSTFSSHLTNIVKILGEDQGNSLVLLDELGAGTDPAEGAALAMAILEELHARQARTVATTHYSELKTFAYTRQGVENASVEFDVATLRPTYRLQLGRPGRSNAFEIASRLGLDEQVVSAARAMLTQENVKIEDLIRSIENNQRTTEEERNSAETSRRRLQDMEEEYRRKMERLEQERVEILRKAREEAASVLKRSREEVNELIGQIRREERLKDQEALAELAREEVEKRSRELEKFSQELRDTQEKNRRSAAGPRRPVKIQVGETVYAAALGQNVQILARPNSSGEVLVQAGIMKVTVKEADLEPAVAEDGQKEKPTWREAGRQGGSVRAAAFKAAAYDTGIGTLAKAKTASISPELDLRGLTVEEAWEKTDKYLDDAFLAGLPQIRIIHGKGTGALRQAIRDRLRAHPNVGSFRFGAFNEGGDGVTVVDLQVH
ncbi:MAG: endonuclease MutS2 [Firmicutes bacterium]|nr:endonuclease MutS2 [Bacillota bacterium]